MFDTAPRARAYLTLARALDAGLPMSSALDLVGQGTSAAERSLLQARALIERDGLPLAEALRRTPLGQRLPKEEVVLLDVGETNGELPSLLRRLAGRLEARHRRSQRFWFSLAYPVLLLHATVLALHAPKVVASPARFLGAVVPSFLLLWLVAATIAGAVWMLSRQHDSRRRLFDGLRRVPMLGSLLRLRSSADYAEVFGLGLATGIPLLQAMQLAGRASAWTALENGIGRAVRAVGRGASLFEAHTHLSSLLPRELLEALRVGEATGSLEELLARSASSLDERAERLATRVAVVVPVVFYLFVALLIAIVVINAFVGFSRLGI